MNLTLLNQFLSSLENIQGVCSLSSRCSLNPREYVDEDRLILEEGDYKFNKFIEYKTNLSKNLIAFDLSTVKLVEVRGGYILSFKGSILESSYWNRGVTLGPYLVYLNNDNYHQILDRFRREFKIKFSSNIKLEDASEILGRYIKDMLLNYIIANYKNNIILTRGSLYLSFFLNQSLPRVSGKCIVISFNLSSSLEGSSFNVEELIGKYDTGYIDVTNYISEYKARSPLLKTYIVRFAVETPLYRVDIYSPKSVNNRLLLNALYSQLNYVKGYPMMLYLARVLSSLTRSELIALRSYLYAKSL